ncbi:hypothetical protein [Mariniradius sediminis]|uniref:VLRF1 domain-containing protein n=1 Tax=Mariniradius sediminis TaxID=2909237 RepID=A0ABS9BYG9_9BACT|nr:hypothetical protein [Mariniradius sediminis]MCF1752671.1 hypothetical protein [Mariniradius sediminis]
MHWEKIDMNLAKNFLNRQRILGVRFNWTKSTQTLEGYEKNGDLKFRLRLPYFMDFDEVSGSVVEASIFNILIILIKAGIGSVGFFENGEISSHKVFRAYMVRKKQGKSQIKYLKTKGKSRAGSRVRLHQTLEFFENINIRVNELMERHHVDRVAISCSKTLWPYLFGGGLKPSFGKDDRRLMRVPIHIPDATHRYLLKTHHLLSSCRILASPEVLHELYAPTFNEPECGKEDSENW